MIERAILEAAARLRNAGEPYLLATAVCQRGSAYRRPGARLIVASDRRVAGAVSGGCLEGDLAMRGWWRTRGRDAVVVTYDSRHEDDADDDEVRAAFAVGCNGVIDVMLELSESYRSDRLDPIAFAEHCVRAQVRGAVATVYRGGPIGARLALCDDRVIADAAFPAELRDAVLADLAGAIATGTSSNCMYDAREVFLEVMVPPPRLFVFGTGADAAPVIALARAVGWDAIACAPQSPLRQRLHRADELVIGPPAELATHVDAAARPVAVVMAHDYELDRAHLDALLGTRALYIGVLGPRARTDRMLADAGRTAGDPRLHAPIGLELGAETPQEIALAIIAEIQAVIADAPHCSLRDRQGPIHEQASQLPPPAEPEEPGPRIACQLRSLASAEPARREA